MLQAKPTIDPIITENNHVDERSMSEDKVGRSESNDESVKLPDIHKHD